MGGNNHKALAAKAKKIYEERLRQILEAEYHGQFVAIEVDSGDYFLGSTPLEAINKGRQKYPDRVFHLMKVGYKAAFTLAGAMP